MGHRLVNHRQLTPPPRPESQGELEAPAPSVPQLTTASVQPTPVQCGAVRPAAVSSTAVRPAAVRREIDPETLIQRFKQQARALTLLEGRLGPEGEALRDALADTQIILNEILDNLPGEEAI